MTFALPSSAPGFDQPIAVLKHCHDRIRKQLATMQKLLAHLPQHGADSQAQLQDMAMLDKWVGVRCSDAAGADQAGTPRSVVAPLPAGTYS